MPWTTGRDADFVSSAFVLVERIGSGPRVVLVHGSVVNGPATWSRQRPLAERWTLELVTRPGFWPLEPVERVDFEADAPLVAEQLGDGAHLVAPLVRRRDLAARRGAAPRRGALADGDRAAGARRRPRRRGGRRDGRPDRGPVVRRDAATRGSSSRSSCAASARRCRCRRSCRRRCSVARSCCSSSACRTRHASRSRRSRDAGFPCSSSAARTRRSSTRCATCWSGSSAAERAVLPGAGHAPAAAPGFNEVLERFLARAEGRVVRSQRQSLLQLLAPLPRRSGFASLTISSR